MPWYLWLLVIALAAWGALALFVRFWIDHNTNREIRAIYPKGRKEFERRWDS